MILQTSPFVAGAQLVFSAVLAIATVVLAVATWNYAKQSKEQIDEMEKSREANFRPVLKPTIENWTGIHHRFTFKNTGKGAAHNVTARWGFSHLDHEVEWQIPLISPEDEHNFVFPFDSEPEPFTELDDLERDLDDDSTLYFKAEYCDSLGNKYETRDELPVLEIARSGAHIEQFQEYELRKIRKEIEKIRKEARKIRKG